MNYMVLKSFLVLPFSQPFALDHLHSKSFVLNLLRMQGDICTVSRVQSHSRRLSQVRSHSCWVLKVRSLLHRNPRHHSIFLSHPIHSELYIRVCVLLYFALSYVSSSSYLKSSSQSHVLGIDKYVHTETKYNID